MSGLPEVVMATVRGKSAAAVKASGFWITDGPVNGVVAHPDGAVTNRRPLLLIDPEDRGGQVSQLRSMLPDVTTNEVQQALRSLAQPATPEPTGLGAVVAGRDGRRWTRIVAQNHIDKRWATTSYVGTWAEVDAVEVLRAGWSE